jgi:hypothetical protein
VITADQLVIHAIGDYIFQSDWMANEKTKRDLPCAIHAITYGLLFLFLGASWKALAVIIVTHYLIDRYRLARYAVWAKNLLAPKFTYEPLTKDGAYRSAAQWRYPWSECAATGYHKDRPAWLSVWLLIIADNILHVLINGLALKYL